MPCVRAADLRIGMSADVTSLDPHYVNISPNNAVAWHVFEALTHVDERARLVPGLAESWRAVDATTWEFKLRRGVKFHDGSDFTAEDVVASIRRWSVKDAAGQMMARFTKELAAVDAKTVRLSLSEPFGLVIDALAQPTATPGKATAAGTQAGKTSGQRVQPKRNKPKRKR